MVFQLKACSMIRTDAQIVGETCMQLEAERGLTAKNLLDASRPEDAPLHPEFEWDDSVAAEEYRLHQARHIINCVVLKPENDAQTPVRAFVHINDGDSSEYKNIEVVMKTPSLHDRMMYDAIKELGDFKRKYESLRELKPVFKAVDRAQQQYAELNAVM